jgi:hypothetical protein
LSVAVPKYIFPFPRNKELRGGVGDIACHDGNRRSKSCDDGSFKLHLEKYKGNEDESLLGGNRFRSQAAKEEKCLKAERNRRDGRISQALYSRISIYSFRDKFLK